MQKVSVVLKLVFISSIVLILAGYKLVFGPNHIVLDITEAHADAPGGVGGGACDTCCDSAGGSGGAGSSSGAS